jgi:hypothetical protein
MFRKLFVLMATAVALGACEQPAPPPPPPPPMASQSFMVFFDWDSTRLNPQSMTTIGQAAAAFKSGANASITAVGHTDTSGSADYNMGLSQRRANVVRDALVANGVPAAAISATGVGEAGLLVQTGDGVREPQNRRVEIAVQGATGGDLAYCNALAKLVRTNSRGADPVGELGNALSQCQHGEPPMGIPVMEKYLTDNKIPLPARM